MNDFSPIDKSQPEKYLRTSIANSPSKVAVRPSIEKVDALADEIVATYKTLSYRKWYCQLCYKLGVQTIYNLMAQAKSGRNPDRLFSSLAKKAEREYDARQKGRNDL